MLAFSGIPRCCFLLILLDVRKLKQEGFLCIAQFSSVQFSSVHSLSRVRLFASPWTSTPGLPVHHHSQSLLKLTSTESVIPSNHFILCHPLLLLPLIFPSIRVFSHELLRIRWPKYWSFSFSISPSNEYSGLFR